MDSVGNGGCCGGIEVECWRCIMLKLFYRHVEDNKSSVFLFIYYGLLEFSVHYVSIERKCSWIVRGKKKSTTALNISMGASLYLRKRPQAQLEILCMFNTCSISYYLFCL